MRTADVIDQAGALPGWTQEYRQLAPGRFAGDLVGLDLPRVGVFVERTNLKLEQDIVPPAEAVVLGVPLAGSEGAVLGCRPVPEDAVMVLCGGEASTFYCAGRMNLGIVVLPEAALRAERPALAAHLEAERHRGGRVVRAPAARDRLRAMLDRLLRLERAPAGEVLPDPLGASVIRTCAGLLEAMLDDPGGADRAAPGTARRAAVVAEACAYIERHPDDVLTVADVARAVGVSERMLEVCFKQARGITPHAYLRVHRLNGARRDLRAGAATGARVTEVATAWGFWHLGRFSAYYKALFGETPQQTLRGR